MSLMIFSSFMSISFILTLQNAGTEKLDTDQHDENIRRTELDPKSDNQGSVISDILDNNENIGISFVARIYQPRTKQVMKITCLASQTLIIKNIAFYTYEGLSSSTVADLSDISDPIACYTVDFKALNKKFQKVLSRYIEKAWHIDDDVNFYVLCSSNHKEQQQYLDWLDKIALFTISGSDLKRSIGT